MGEEYEDIQHCGHCNRGTLHKCRDDTHERDSSADWRECQVCGYYRLGIGKYQPPILNEEDDN
jgi:hypothetical protein